MASLIQHIGITCGEKNEDVATFYKEAFGMTEVNITNNHRERSGIYISDGIINLACLMAPQHPVGRLHFGFKVADIEQTFAAAEKFGGRVGDRERPKDGRFAEASVRDPIGTSVDISVGGWRQRTNPTTATLPVIQHIGLTTGDAVEEVATFYKAVFQMKEVNVTSHHRERSGIYLSDGNINLACLMSPHNPLGGLHFGFKVDDVEEKFDAVLKYGGTIGDQDRPKDGRFAEAGVFDPIRTGIDLAAQGWRLVPGGPPH